MVAPGPLRASKHRRRERRNEAARLEGGNELKVMSLKLFETRTKKSSPELGEDLGGVFPLK